MAAPSIQTIPIPSDFLRIYLYTRDALEVLDEGGEEALKALLSKENFRGVPWAEAQDKIIRLNPPFLSIYKAPPELLRTVAGRELGLKPLFINLKNSDYINELNHALTTGDWSHFKNASFSQTVEAKKNILESPPSKIVKGTEPIKAVSPEVHNKTEIQNKNIPINEPRRVISKPNENPEFVSKSVFKETGQPADYTPATEKIDRLKSQGIINKVVTSPVENKPRLTSITPEVGQTQAPNEIPIDRPRPTQEPSFTPFITPQSPVRISIPAPISGLGKDALSSSGVILKRAQPRILRNLKDFGKEVSNGLIGGPLDAASGVTSAPFQRFSRGRGNPLYRFGFGGPGGRRGGGVRFIGGNGTPGGNKKWLKFLLIFLLIILAVGVFLTILGDPNNTSSGVISQVKVTKTGPDKVALGENIIYEITAINGASSSADLKVTDALPTNTSFVSASDNGNLVGNSVTWLIKNAAPGVPKRLSLTLKPSDEDSWVVNEAQGSLELSSFTAAPGSGTAVDPKSVASITDFDTLMTGQGRNTNVLGGSENEFINNLKNNLAGTARASLASSESNLRQIYQAGIAKQVNPLILTAIWIEESGADTSGRYFAFGCDPYGVLGTGKDFGSQLQCSVNTWNNLMKEFESKTPPVTIPSKIGNSCVYYDAFLYASEKYGPVCAINDSNENYHKNFVDAYRLLLGVK